MFWNKKQTNALVNEPTIQDMAKRLGVERRANVRVHYPERTLATLPAISYNGAPILVHDISVGGCCLLDASEILGANVGIELDLGLHFSDGVETVHSRMVGRIDDRRHMQFINLAPDRQNQLRIQMAFGFRALSLRPGLRLADNRGPQLAARELWSSSSGDALIIEDSPQRLAQAEIRGEKFYFFRESWPVNHNSATVSLDDLYSLILFLANINYRSDALTELLEILEDFVMEAAK